MSEEIKAKILCVEDEQEVRESIAEILRDEGFEVFEAGDGKSGFESFLRNKPDLIISDIMMPEVDGFALLKMVRENKNVRNNLVPFIFLTALWQKDSIIKGVSLSANDYLIKPIDFDLMIAKVREKIASAIKIQSNNDANIKNIKNQVAVALPSEVLSYLNVITQISSILKQEPYGPFPHRRYLEDIDRIYINSMRLKTAIANSLDESVIDHKLNSDEEIFTITNFLSEFVESLSDKFRSKIKFDYTADVSSMPLVKLDRMILLDALRKIFAGMLKCDPEAAIVITVMIDHLDQMALIFYLKSESSIDLNSNLDQSQVSKILDRQNCRFEIIENREKGAILFIPSYRLIKN